MRIASPNVSEIRNQGHVSRYMTKVGQYMTKSNDGMDRNWRTDAKFGLWAGLDAVLCADGQPPKLGWDNFLSCYRKEVFPPAVNDTDAQIFPLFDWIVQHSEEGLTFAQYLHNMNTKSIPQKPHTRGREGTVALAIEFTSPWRDSYFAQWLMMFHRWHRRTDLPETRSLVPLQYTWLA